MQIFECNKFFNLQNSTKCFLFSFNCKLSCFVSHLSFSHAQKYSFFCAFYHFYFVASLFLSLLTLCFSRLEVLKLLNSSNFFSFLSCFSATCQCSISSSCDIDSELSISVSCNTSLAILTLLEAVLQHFCSSTLCLQQGRGSTLVSLFRQKLLWRHNVTFLSKSSSKISSFSLSSHSLVLEVLFTSVVTAFR